MLALALMFPLSLAAAVKVDLSMPGTQPQTPDTYLCHAMKMDQDPKYIVGFETHAHSENAHHVLLFGCEEPGRTDGKAWNCGEMSAINQVADDAYPTAGVCGGGKQQIVYAWASDAPALKLPEGVGFKVGGETDIKYLVLQVHYKDVTPFLPSSSEMDHSGITLEETSTPQPKRAGVILLGTGGLIPRDSIAYMETACSYNGEQILHPFAFRTHGHTLAKVTSGYRVRAGEWQELGRKSPRKPQMFYNVTDSQIDVEPHDVLAARCTFLNDVGHAVRMGATQNDEMCNFYIMYYVDGDQLPEMTTCWKPGAPLWSWSDFTENSFSTEKLPETVSTDPDTKAEYMTEDIYNKQKAFEQLRSALLLGGEPLLRADPFEPEIEEFIDEY